MELELEKEKEIKKLPELFRSYLISTEDDIYNLDKGLCPDYALIWTLNEHIKYWPKGHDFTKGYELITTEKKYPKEQRHYEHLRLIQKDIFSQGLLLNSNNPIIFCDLDGVLADFDKGVEKICNNKPNNLNASNMWAKINITTGFFENLEWMPDAKQLWEKIKQYKPIILTGVPNENKKIEEQKKRWCERELGADIRVITCKTEDKPKYCISGSILIDDRTIIQNAWIQNGGIFIHYTNTETALSSLSNCIKSYTK